MAEVLSQDEIDQLLSAISAGEISTEEIHQPRDQRKIKIYDFKRPERVSKEQMRALEGIHDSFSRNFGASLSALLRTIVEARVATTEQLTYSEFIHSLPNPTNFNLLTVEPLEGQMCLEISPLIIYPIIDRLLGGELRATGPRINWATLLRRTYAIDVFGCPACGGRMRPIAEITDPEVIERILEHLATADPLKPRQRSHPPSRAPPQPWVH